MSTLTAFSSGAPRWGEPMHATWRKSVHPRLVVLPRVVRGAPCDQASHAVADERDLLDRHRVRVEHLGDQLGERSPVLGDVQAGVVTKIDRREAEVVAESRAERHVGIAIVLLRGKAPQPLGRGQAVHEHANLPSRVRKGRREGVGVAGR